MISSYYMGKINVADKFSTAERKTRIELSVFRIVWLWFALLYLYKGSKSIKRKKKKEKRSQKFFQ